MVCSHALSLNICTQPSHLVFFIASIHSVFIDRYISVGNSETNISLDIDYTPLPPFSLNYSLPVPPSDQGTGYCQYITHNITSIYLSQLLVYCTFMYIQLLA